MTKELYVRTALDKSTSGSVGTGKPRQVSKNDEAAITSTACSSEVHNNRLFFESTGR